MADLTHASFFSGVGGLDMGLERAGWRTVSFSEIDPYASAVLAQRWPSVPNLGNIVQLASRFGSGAVHESGDGAGTQYEPDTGHQSDGRRVGQQREPAGDIGPTGTPDDKQLVRWDAASRADLWTGGFPCQDLSVAGKRRGMVAGTRSGLAYSFLALAERHRPRFVLLENVPGLLSSHGGRDMAALIGALVELGYGVGYRVLDARYFGVPQRRRRVFILGDSLGGRAGAERAAEVLSVGSRCRRHPPTGIEAGPGVAAGAQPGVDIARAVTGTSGKRHDDDTDTLIANGLRASDGHHGYGSPRGDGGDNLIAGTLRVGGRAQGAGSSYDNTPITVAGPIRSHLRPGSNSLTGIVRETPDPGRMRAPDGLAGRSHDRAVVNALDQQRGGADDNAAQAGHLVTAYHKATKAHEADGLERWEPADVSDTLDANAMGAVAGSAIIGGAPAERDMLPLGLDSHRYRCCGNGVVSDVSEWIGLRLAEVARAIA